MKCLVVFNLQRSQGSKRALQKVLGGVGGCRRNLSKGVGIHSGRGQKVGLARRGLKNQNVPQDLFSLH